MMAMRVVIGSFVGILGRARRVCAAYGSCASAAGSMGTRPSVAVGMVPVGATTESHHQEQSASEKRQRDERIE
jgi:hypothetical protein